MRARLPGVPDEVAERVCVAVARLREEDLYKLPGVGETIAWARALLALEDAAARRRSAWCSRCARTSTRCAQRGCSRVSERLVALGSPPVSACSRRDARRRRAGRGRRAAGRLTARCVRSTPSDRVRDLPGPARRALLAPRGPRGVRRRVRRGVRRPAGVPRAARACWTTSPTWCCRRWPCRPSGRVAPPARDRGGRGGARPRGRTPSCCARRTSPSSPTPTAGWRARLLAAAGRPGPVPPQPPHARTRTAPGRGPRGGRADLRGTVRASLRYGGEPVERHWREPRRAARARWCWCATCRARWSRTRGCCSCTCRRAWRRAGGSRRSRSARRLTRVTGELAGRDPERALERAAHAVSRLVGRHPDRRRARHAQPRARRPGGPRRGRRGALRRLGPRRP